MNATNNFFSEVLKQVLEVQGTPVGTNGLKSSLRHNNELPYP